MTALDPTGLLPDSTTLESLCPERLTSVEMHACYRAGIVTVGDVRAVHWLGGALGSTRIAARVHAAIRTDLRPDLSPGYAADAEPVADFTVGVPSKAQRLAAATQDDAERLSAQLDDALAKLEHVQTSRGELLELLDAAELRATVA
jgi:hypothetical protein